MCLPFALKDYAWVNSCCRFGTAVFTGSVAVSRPFVSDVSLLTTLTKSKIEIGDRIVAILADHKAAAGVKGNVGSGGDCRVESALPGLRIGHTCDEELIHFSTLASFMSLKKRYVKGPSRSLRRLSSSDVYTCTACQ